MPAVPDDAAPLLARGAHRYRGPLKAALEQTETWNRGRYLVRAVSHCDQCHSPRTSEWSMVQRARRREARAVR